MTSENMVRFKQLLVTNSCHVTKSRIMIFELIVQNRPQSLRNLLKLSKGTVDRVSLYRNIALFEKLGIVQRVHIGWKYKIELTDFFVAHHHHLSCLGCGKVVDIEDEKNISSFIHKVVKQYDFKPLRHQFEIEGYCKACTK